MNNNQHYFKNNSFKNEFTIICYLFTLLKYLFMLSMNLDIETRINLLDYSLFIVGLKLYIYLVLMFGVSSALMIRILFYFTSDERLLYWTKLFDIIDANISRDELDLNKNRQIICSKLIVRTKYLNKFLKLSKFIYCK